MSTRSPAVRLGTAWNHFLRAVKRGKYSCNHLFQMWVVMTRACRQRFWLDISLSAKIPGGKLGVALPMRKWFGVNASRSSASELTSVNGRLLTRDSTSVIAVNNTSPSELDSAEQRQGLSCRISPNVPMLPPCGVLQEG